MMARLLLRSHRTGFLVVSVFGMFDVFINTAAYAQVAGHTEAARQAFAAATAPLATQLSYLLRFRPGWTPSAGTSSGAGTPSSRSRS